MTMTRRALKAAGIATTTSLGRGVGWQRRCWRLPSLALSRSHGVHKLWSGLHAFAVYKWADASGDVNDEKKRNKVRVCVSPRSGISAGRTAAEPKGCASHVTHTLIGCQCDVTQSAEP
jgi:hypothetical protein